MSSRTAPVLDFALLARLGMQSAAIADGLTDEQWEQPSTCAGWKVKHLIAHQATGTTYSLPRLLGYVLRYRKPERAGHHMALDMGDSLAREEVMAEFRRGHGDRPANTFVRISDKKYGLIDVTIHLQDLRRSVGDPGEVPAEVLRMVLGLLHVTAGPTRTKKVVNGLSLHATDLKVTVGDGPVVSGPAEALMMAAGGRREALPELSGPGLATLSERIGGPLG
jgi:uncharacterized protein (TIGR03083 family)